MSTYYRDKQRAKYRKEAQAFRTRADINEAYVNLKMEYDKEVDFLTFDQKPHEVFINSDLSALVVQLSETIAKISQRNANLQRENKELAASVVRNGLYDY